VLLCIGCERSKAPDFVLLIVIDTLRADHLGCYGYEAISTPNIDRLAKEGVLFENAITATPVTLPSVATILTGAYPLQHGIRDNGPYQLNTAWETLAERLRKAGYSTGAFVSAAVLSRDHNLGQGFDIYDDDVSEPFRVFDPSMAQFTSQRQGLERRADKTVSRAIEWLELLESKRAFLLIHLFDPHLLRDPPPPFNSRYVDRPYDGEIAFVDQEIGRLLDAVRERWDASECLTIIVSDHGEGLGDHEEEFHGFLLYEETMRVPLILHGFGLPRGESVAELARTVDIAPTICDLLRLEPSAASPGRPLLSIVDPSVGSRSSRRSDDRAAAYLETFRSRISYGWSELRGMRTERWKLVIGPYDELYDLEIDPFEERNLANDCPGVRDSLESLMDATAFHALRLGTRSPGSLPMTTEEIARLESLGYTTGGSPAPSHEDSLAIWGFAEPDRGPVLNLPHPRTRMEAYRERLLAKSFDKAGETALDEGRLDDAVRYFKEAIIQDETFADPHLGLAMGYERMGDDGAMLDILYAAHARYVCYDAITVALSDALEARRRRVHARTIIEKALTECERAKLVLYDRLASFQLDEDDLKGAAETMRRAAESFPDDGGVRWVLATIYRDLGRLNDAMESSIEAIRLSPELAKAHYLRGEIAHDLGDNETTARAWTRYLELQPEGPESDRARDFLREREIRDHR